MQPLPTTVRRLLFVLIAALAGTPHSGSATPVGELQDLSRAVADLTNGQRLESLPAPVFAAILQTLPLDKLPLAPEHHTKLPNQQEEPTPADARQQAILARLLPPVPAFVTAVRELPHVQAVWQDLLLRLRPVVETRASFNFMMASFANYVFDDMFSTRHNSSGAQRSTTAPLLAGMTQLYGQTLERQHALRTMQGGKLKVSHVGGNQYPPLLSDIHDLHHDFEMAMPREVHMTCPIKSNTTCNKYSTAGAFRGAGGYYAMGSPRLNAHIGHLVWGTLFLRLHNHVCDMLAMRNPGLDDQMLYNTAQLIVKHIQTKFVLEDYLFDTVSFLRDQAGVTYDPDALRTLPYPKLTPELYMEHDQLQRWHNLVPEWLDLPSSPRQFTDFAWNPAQLATVPLAHLLRAFHHTRTGAFTSNNIPYYLGPVTRQTLLDARAQRLQGYNAYRVHFGLDRLQSFEEFGLNPDITAQMQQLYTDIDTVDFYVGIMLEQPPAGSPLVFGEGMTMMHSAFTLSTVLNLDLITDPALWSEDALTPEGRLFVQHMTLETFLQEFGGGVQLPCAFRAPGRPCPASTSTSAGFAWHEIFDFVGLDAAIRPFFSHLSWLSVLGAMTVGLVAVGGCLLAVGYSWSVMAPGLLQKLGGDSYGALPVQEQSVVCMHACFVFVLGLQAVPYAWLVFSTLFGADFTGGLQRHAMAMAAFAAQHVLLYVLEAFADRGSIKGALLWDRAIYGTLLLLAVCSNAVFGLKLAMLVDFFVVFEGFVYAALIVVRLKVAWQTAKSTLHTASVVYSLSRFVQAGVLAVFCIGSVARLQRAGQMHLLGSCVVLALTLTVVQMHRGLMLYRQSQGSAAQDVKGALLTPKPRNGHKHAAQED